MSKKVLVKKSKLKKLKDFYRLVGSRKSCTYIDEKGEKCHYLGDDQSKIAILRAMAQLKNKLHKSMETVAVKNDEIKRLSIGLNGWKERCINNTVKDQNASNTSWTNKVEGLALDFYCKNGDFVFADLYGTEKCRELKVLKYTVEEVEDKNARLNALIKLKSDHIEKLQVQNERLQAIVDGKGKQIVKLYDQKSALSAEAVKKDKKIKRLEECIARYAEEAAAVDAQVKSLLLSIGWKNDVLVKILERRSYWATFFKSFTLTTIREHMKTDAGAGLKALFESRKN